VSPDGVALYVADAANHRVRVVALGADTGFPGVHTIAGAAAAYAPAGGHRDGSTTTALFRHPSGLAVVRDHAREVGNMLYVADSADHRVRRVQLSGSGMTGQEVTTLVGGGPGAGASAGTGTEVERERGRHHGGHGGHPHFPPGLAGHVDGPAADALFLRPRWGKLRAWELIIHDLGLRVQASGITPPSRR
jgi:hypothetical protein